MDPKDFERYAHYLYTGNIACKREDVTDEFDTLAKSYALGERLMDITYKDTVIDAFIVTTGQESPFGRAPTIDCINIIWESTPKGSLARELLIDLYTMQAGFSFEFGNDENPANPEFLREIAEALASRREPSMDESADLEERMSGTSCAYHEHKETEECTARKRRKLG